MYTLNCRGRLLTLKEPIVMGILNVTPDSFYQGSRIDSKKISLDKAGQMLEEGATILDIGGQSSRPGAETIGIDEELKRVIPAIEVIRCQYPNCYISIDTFYSEVAIRAVEVGADMINDISAGGIDKEMFDAVARLNVPYIAMHMRGTPANMNSLNTYDDLITDVLDYFREKTQLCLHSGIKDILIDPGFGFSKTTEQNFEVLKKLEAFQILGFPVLVGLSRKSMIYKTLEISPEEALNGTTILNTIALQKGAMVLRVHDVREALECIKLTSSILK
jgi:dihydropteroate synthase